MHGNSEVSLQYYASKYIMDYCARHPIRWYGLDAAKRAGNLKLEPSVMRLFFSFLRTQKALFTQDEFWEYVRAELEASGRRVCELQQGDQDDIGARIGRNFYPSAIDSLHVWALMVETGEFRHCRLDTAEDAYSKVDLTAEKIDGSVVRVALSIDSEQARKWGNHKKTHRGAAPEGTYVVKLEMSAPRNPGNKRWYSPDHLVRAGIVSPARMPQPPRCPANISRQPPMPAKPKPRIIQFGLFGRPA